MNDDTRYTIFYWAEVGDYVVRGRFESRVGLRELSPQKLLWNMKRMAREKNIWKDILAGKGYASFFTEGSFDNIHFAEGTFKWILDM